MALDDIYCLGVCGQSSDLSRFMIQCDICKDWFHGRCVGVREYQAVDINRFHCPRCEPYHGPSVLKARLNWHRHDYSESDAANKSVQTGTQVFIKELRGRHFHDCDKIVTRLSGNELTLALIAGVNDKFAEGESKAIGSGCGFTHPILVEEKTGLDIVLPHPTFNVVDVENCVGPDQEVDVIDVQRQTDVKMRLREFVEYFQSPARTTVLNLISLEISGTGLSQLVEPPSIVRKLCWVNTAWPTDPPPPPPLNRPNVSKYCLIGVENSYTDFHIDFGGTSVWYHVLWGEKVFYLIKPTPGNILLYERWMKAGNHSELFFGDQVDACYKCVVRAGQTMFIPTGWIHAVLTPTDTLVFGGNFLHSYAIDAQLQIFELEQTLNTPVKFRFPNYEEVCWYAGSSVLQQLRSTATPPNSLIHGAKALYNALRQWLQQGVRGVSSHVPEGLSAAKLLKELQKELRSSERNAVALHPPRPERESKRRKKKQLADDFVDYTNLTSFHTALEERLPKKESSDYDSSDEKQSLPDEMVQSHSLLFKNEEAKSHSLLFKSEEAKSILGINDGGNGVITEENDSDDITSVEDGVKISLPRPISSYPYNLLTSQSDYGMSGTPPHHNDYPSQFDYPQNVKSEFDWSDTPGVTPYRLARSSSSVVISSEVSTTPVQSATNRLMPLRLHLGRETAEDVSQGDSNSLFYMDSTEETFEDEGGLMIDETPRRNRGRGRNTGVEVVYGGSAVEVGGEVEVAQPQQTGGMNGIEELLRASAYAPAEYAQGTAYQYRPAEEIEGSGRASPSTRDAIAGMLSMSREVAGNSQEIVGIAVSGRHKLQYATVTAGQRRTPATIMSKQHNARKYLEEESMKKVHQDDDYVYPTLDHSDDEDYPVFKPRGKKKEDEAWNPKARVRVWGPKPERPARVGVKRQAVEKGLEVAANRRNSIPAAKRAYHRKKSRGGLMSPLGVPSLGGLSGGASTSGGLQSVSSISHHNTVHHQHSNHRPKKGMATAKQRLGKILKIHKMIY